MTDVRPSSGVDRRTFLVRSMQVGAFAFGGSALLAACSSSSSSVAPATSGSASGSVAPGSYGTPNVQLSWIKNIEFAGEYFADTKGYYTDGGFAGVNLIAGGAAGTGVEAGLDTGKVWIGMSAPQLTAPAVLQGLNAKIVGATYQKNPFAIMSMTKNPIKTPQDMIGKKIGVQDSNTLVFDALLKANGLTASQMDIVSVQYDPTPLTTGTVDGWVSYITNEPITLKGKGFDVTTFLFADYSLPLVAETLTVTQDTIDNERAKLKAFLTAEIKGWKDAVASPAASATLAVTKYGKDQQLSVAEQTLEATAQNLLVVSADTKTNGLFSMTDALITQNIDALGKAGIAITADQLFDLSIVKEIYQENPSLI